MSQTEMRSSVRPLTTPGSSVPTSAFSASYAGGVDMNAGDGLEHGVPIRPPASAQLLIDSRDRGVDADGLPLENANDFILSSKGNGALLYGYFTRVAITQINFDWFVPTLLDGYNSKITVVNTTTATTATIDILTAGGSTSGYFAPADLAALLQAALRATANIGNPALTVQFSDLYGALEYATNNGDDLRFLTPLQADPSRGALYKDMTKTYRTIGVSSAMQTIANDTNVFAPPRPSTSYVDIFSERLTKFQRVKDADTTQENPRSFQIARLYLTPPGQRVVVAETASLGSQPFTICVDYNTPKHIKWSTDEALYQLDLQVRDMDGDLLPWDGELSDWEYQLTVLASET